MLLYWYLLNSCVGNYKPACDCFHSAALESLGFGSYITEVKDVLQECKTVALKRRKASSRLENLGIPEEELLRQQQELFAKVRVIKGKLECVFVMFAAMKCCLHTHKSAHPVLVLVVPHCCGVTFLQARQQQAEIAQQEWLQVQQAAQQAQIAASSANPAQQTSSSQDEDEEEDM